jgi:diacylglycerol kinase (ATP)
VRITIMHNPTAGEGGHDADSLISALEGRGHEARYQSVKKRRFLDALDGEADLVFVAGGDGTVKKVARALAGTGLPMAILPCGTANNVVKAFRAVRGLEELIERLEDAPRAKLDIGRVRTDEHEQRFVESTGGGLFASVIRSGRRAEDGSPHLPGNSLDRALVLLRRQLAVAEPASYELLVDGADHSGSYLLVEAMNIRLIGPNVALSSAADPGDGMLDVVMVNEERRDALLAYLDARIAGEISELDLPSARGTRVLIRTHDTSLHVDDEPRPPEPEDDDEDSELEETADRRANGSVRGRRVELTAEMDGSGVELLVVPEVRE